MSGFLLACAPLLIGCSGCDGSKVAEQVKQTANQVQQTVTDTVDKTQNQVKEQLNLVGSSEVTLDPAASSTPVKAPACYVTFTPPTGGRGGVLALRSYREAEKETFPSFFVQATTSAATLSELTGQTVPAQMFVKASAEGATWHTTPSQPVQLKIVALENKQLTAEVLGGSLSSAAGQPASSATGKFVGVLP
jgi:hypothetical protein